MQERPRCSSPSLAIGSFVHVRDAHLLPYQFTLARNHDRRRHGWLTNYKSSIKFRTCSRHPGSLKTKSYPSLTDSMRLLKPIVWSRSKP